MQKSTLKKTAIIFFVVLLLLAAVPFFKFSSETKKMHPVPTGTLSENIYTVNSRFVNVYLIRNNDSYIAIDAGTDKKTLIAEFKKLGINPEMVTAVFLTHTDSDHAGGLGAFPNAQIYISTDEEQMINGKTNRAFIMKNHLSKPYRLIKDNEMLEINGLSVRGLLNPGHTPGSMSYIVNDSCIFTGDALSIKNSVVCVFNEFFNMDTEEQKRSIAKLAHLKGLKHIYTAHYGFSDIHQSIFKDFN